MSEKITDDVLRDIFLKTRTVAIVGISPDPAKPSHYVPAFMQREYGYKIIPVHPAHVGTTILGEPVVATLADLPEGVDFVEIFRAAPAIAPFVVEAAQRGIPYIWMPLGVRHEESAAQARALGATVIQDRCPKIDLPRLFPGGLPNRNLPTRD
ncbi:CoA-binding protein [Nitrospirillum sp. BR 11163]|uniref:CoA-binding protein n=1 Tax=Nitrospirillum sp. BR 11163 TaxID=3104323 RepID=UPI002AFF2513|nr:CoA-binding protein [Nitrospirillum sp. BR 11163]MEA1676335.1 CoA-binding protein [Nitrospirillum sp. BR 11163]